MKIKSVTSTYLKLPEKAKENKDKDPYDLDIRIQDLIDTKERIPSKGCGTTNTCPSGCGTCATQCSCNCKR